jgi:hypothetical protein
VIGWECFTSFGINDWLSQLQSIPDLNHRVYFVPKKSGAVTETLPAAVKVKKMSTRYCSVNHLVEAILVFVSLRLIYCYPSGGNTDGLIKATSSYRLSLSLPSFSGRPSHLLPGIYPNCLILLWLGCSASHSLV